MGMYTELHFNAELKKNTPKSVIDILNYMIGKAEKEPELPDDALFNTSRWVYMLQMDSYYFNADTISTLRFDDISSSYYLCIRCNLKNYDDEIKKFINWINHYLDAHEGEFLGFSRYEETERPTLIYFKGKQQLEDKERSE